MLLNCISLKNSNLRVLVEVYVESYREVFLLLAITNYRHYLFILNNEKFILYLL
ncbi:Uncharacterised protein [Legionella bozemanae]|uniref:Uncharacterized protein n=1 Tax=Legionella bozemanae TaxID=447 RepID=A0A0W0RRI0_LEGBO|nr:hypothetical protein Lboz_2302 [Legionella bozemanae]STO33475.1 Uncharacterised protein [Legionella bozemanae]